MTTKEKLFDKFLKNPTSIKYNDIEKILLLNWFEKIYAKGSHIKMKHKNLENDLIIPLHNWDCKDFYKKEAYEKILFIKNHKLWNTI